MGTVLLIGGLVTSTESGMAVPDWPGTFGANMFLYPIGLMAHPRIFLEHSHRLFGAMAGLVSILALLALWTGPARARGEGVRASEDAEWVTVLDRRYDVLDLEDALTELERIDPLAAETASMRLFGGLGVAECAEGLAVSTRTIERRWRFARSWLVAELTEDAR